MPLGVTLGAGALFGRIPPRFLLSVMLLLLGLGLVMSDRLSSEASVWLYGAIRGQVFTAVVIGSALGPPWCK
jgi:hypothetical protein